MKHNLGELVSRLRVSNVAGACELPQHHACVGGWHVRWSNGWKTRYERCTRADKVVASRLTFESFQREREPLAYDAMQRFASGELQRVVLLPTRQDGASGLWAASSTGCGKTHLLRAAEAAMQGWRLYVDCYKWQRARWSDGGAQLRDSWLHCDVLLVDHLGKEQEGEGSVASVLEQVIDERGDKALALATDLSRAEIETRYGKAFASRLFAGAAVPELRGEDYRAGV